MLAPVLVFLVLILDIAVALLLIERQRLLRMASRDALTGLSNRAALDQALRRIIRQENGACAILIDLDRFKQVNDHLGHAAGDDLLVAVANVLRAQLRRGDHAYRYGGDELCVLLPTTRLAVARAVAGRIDTALAQTFKHARAQGIPVGASMGLAEVVAADTPQTWIARADRALYRAKGAGSTRRAVA